MYKIVSSSKNPLDGDTWQNSFLRDYEWVVLEKIELQQSAVEQETAERSIVILGLKDALPKNSNLNYENFLPSSSANRDIGIPLANCPGANIFECGVCQRKFKRKCGLVMHKRIHENRLRQKRAKCDICQKTFFDYSTLYRHKRLHSGERPFNCSICHRAFSRKDNFNSHCRLHDGTKPILYNRHFLAGRRLAFKFKKSITEVDQWFKCDTCHKRFVREHSLKIHRRLHLPFKCKICNEAFSMKHQIVAHSKIYHSDVPSEYSGCYGVFSHYTKNDTQNTINNAIEQQFEIPLKLISNYAYQCDKCQKPFALRSNLIEHERTHSGLKPFECELCLKKFASRGNLNIHRRIHTGEKPYRCKICPRAFIEKNKLIMHNRIHSGAKPYECVICTKKFSRRRYLTAHYRVHTGERPFQCEICQKFFVEGSACNRHRKTHVLSAAKLKDADI